MHCYKQSIEKDLVQLATRTTIQKFYDRGLIDKYDNAEEVLKIFLFTRWRLGLDQVNANEN